ncbi:MAG: hypothetical protein D8M59_08915 [Planctomycetes bacterium]|nr:hypothetical protein [Planctomycetota bacterium]NOG54181.1 hypothetical protein [Planctomycetota bacterium]
MRILSTEQRDSTELTSHQRFFVELWHSLTHSQSLDSYRVKCLNIRGLVAELDHELSVGLLNADELAGLCSEVLEAVDTDPIVSVHYQSQIREMTLLVKKLPKSENREKRNKSDWWRALRFTTRDFLMALNKSYYLHICSELPHTVRENNECKVKRLLSAMLSDLVAQGWPLYSLFKWHLLFVKRGDTAIYTFDQNLQFMLNQIGRGPQAFRVTLRLSGSRKLADLDVFHDFRLTDTLSISASEQARIRGSNPNKFLRSQMHVRFATKTLHAVDHASAAEQARIDIDELLDLIRFDFESRIIRLDRRCLVRREGDGRIVLHEVRQGVPNPRAYRGLSDFRKLAERVDRFLARQDIGLIARQQLQTALRQYRFGRDAESYRDKFISWWMGLEALTNFSNEYSIGHDVMVNTSRAIIAQYPLRLIVDLLETMVHMEIPWTTEFSGASACANLKDVSAAQFLSVIQTPELCDKIWDACKEHPVVVYYGKIIQGFLSDPKRLAEQIETHRKHVEWQLSRLYRIRCCIVHGSPIIFDLALFIANLEYYLKETIRFVLDAFDTHEHILDLEELFHRACARHSRVSTLLTGDDAEQQAISQAVFADVVL